MKILAFSDWRVQDINLLIEYLDGLKELPDVIVYAGDDISRFNRVPYKFLPIELKERYRQRLKEREESLEDVKDEILDDLI